MSVTRLRRFSKSPNGRKCAPCKWSAPSAEAPALIIVRANSSIKVWGIGSQTEVVVSATSGIRTASYATNFFPASLVRIAFFGPVRIGDSS